MLDRGIRGLRAPAIAVAGALALSSAALAESVVLSSTDPEIGSVAQSESSSHGGGQTGHASNGQKKWQPHIDAEGRFGPERHIGEANIFVPLLQDGSSMFFANLSGKWATDESYEGNFGLGVRHVKRGRNLGLGDVIFGGYAFLDVRRSPNDFTYLQGSFGVEVLGENWGLRNNWYFPDRDPNVLSSLVSIVGGGPAGIQLNGINVVNVVGGVEITTVETSERALPGVDIEGEYGFDLTDDHQLWLMPGYFYFDTGETPSVDGPRLRTEFRWNDPLGWDGSRITIGGQVQHDDIRGIIGSGTVRLRIPFGAMLVGIEHERYRQLSRIDARMT